MKRKTSNIDITTIKTKDLLVVASTHQHNHKGHQVIEFPPSHINRPPQKKNPRRTFDFLPPHIKITNSTCLNKVQKNCKKLPSCIDKTNPKTNNLKVEPPCSKITTTNQIPMH